MCSPDGLKEGGVATPFHLILAEADDHTALRLCRALRRYSDAEFVTPEELFMAAYWSHDPLGKCYVELASGIKLNEDTVLSVFNRVRHVSPLQFARSTAADQIYASEEFFALIISWLAGFGDRCVNQPHPGSVAGYAARSLTEDRLRLGSELHASSRARHLGLGQQISGFPEEEESLIPGGPGQLLTEIERRQVLIVGDEVSEELPVTLRQRLYDEMTRRQLTVAEASLNDFGNGFHLTAINPLPEVDEEAHILLIARHLMNVARPARGVA